MNIGRMNKQIDIERNTAAIPSTSGGSDSWVVFLGNLWAAIWPLKGDEAVMAMQTQAVVSHRVRMRYREGILPSMRVRYGSRYFNIVAAPININEENKEIELLCQEVIGG
jgi:SPP1 family predicted phage head-tail adaptor